MQKIKSKLQETQPIAYQILQNAFSNKKTSHAYLIHGNNGAPVLEVAKFIAKSFICEHAEEDALACEECLSCQRIENQNYADFIFYDGDNIKKDDILFLQNEFNKSATEKANIKIYIIHLIEKVSIISLNKLLKFIEEPTSSIIAIFTTYSLSSILSTIVSRCQLIQLKPLSSHVLVEKMIQNGILEEDAKLISRFNNDLTSSLQIIQDENYNELKENVAKSLKWICDADDMYFVFMQTQILPFLDKNSFLNIYLDMLEVCLFEAIRCHSSKEIPAFFPTEITDLYQCNDLEKKILAIVNAKKDLLSNANKQLLIDKLLIQLIGR